MITIQNDRLCVTVSEKGAELQSILLDGEERLWQGDPAVWAGRAPIMFPFCGALPDNGFTYDGRRYTVLRKHGFARDLPFTVIDAKPAAVTMRLTESEATLAQYPFPFSFDVTFSLDGASLSVTFTVCNNGERTMWFSLGAHEAYACPEGVGQYEIEFEQPETAGRYLVIDQTGHLSEKPVPFFKNCLVYRPDPATFEADAVVTKDIRSRSLVFRRQDGKRAVRITFEGFDCLLFWQKPGAGFLCVEPWCGVAQRADGDPRIEQFDHICSAEPGKAFVRTHTLSFL